MKRLLALFAGLLLFSFTLSGCSCSSNAGNKFGEIVAERRQAMNSASPKLDDAKPLKIETYEDANFSKSLGFNITAYPSSAEIHPRHFYVLDDWFAQIEFTTADGQGYVLRAAFTNKGFLTTTYTEPHTASDATREVNGVEIRTRNSINGCSMITWNQGEFQLLLHSNRLQGQPPDALVDTFVSQTVCQAA